MFGIVVIFVRLFCDICWQYYVIDTSRVLVIFPLRHIINFRRKMVRRCLVDSVVEFLSGVKLLLKGCGSLTYPVAEIYESHCHARS